MTPKKHENGGQTGAAATDGSMFYRIAEKALLLERKGKRILRLNVGDTNLPVPACAIAAARKGMTSKAVGYGSSAGMAEFREIIAKREGCKIENVVVGPGSKHLIFALLSVLAKKGDNVAIPSPHWPMYGLACRQLNLRANFLCTALANGWQLPEIPRSASVAIICNPLNPTSTLYDEKEMKRAIDETAEQGTRVILDEAYKGLSFKPMPKYRGAIRVRSFSKEFNMEEWRLAYAVAPAGIAEKLIAYNQITSTCVPSFIQEAGIACLENETALLGKNARAWKARLARATEALEEQGFEFAAPQSGMYIFATHKRIHDSEKYALALLDEGVAVAPGSSFGDYRKFVRICANQPEDILAEAIGKMGSAL